MYHILYKTTNLKTNSYYIGVHSTENKNDGYLGSGTVIKKKIAYYGRGSFKKEILECFSTAKEAYIRESEIVDEEFIADKNTYNLSLGGLSSSQGISFEGIVSVKDSEGNFFKTSITDPRYISGELVGVAKSTITVKDKEGRTFKVSEDDSRYLNGELVGVVKGTVTVKDSEGKCSRVPKNDPRYLNGELVGVTRGKKMTSEEKRKRSESSIGHKKEKSTKKKMSGYAKERVWINKDGKTSHCNKNNLQEKLDSGWNLGMKPA